MATPKKTRIGAYVSPELREQVVNVLRPHESLSDLIAGSLTSTVKSRRRRPPPAPFAPSLPRGPRPRK